VRDSLEGVQSKPEFRFGFVIKFQETIENQSPGSFFI